MRSLVPFVLAASVVVAGGASNAASLSVRVENTHNRPASKAVVSIETVPPRGAVPATPLKTSAVIDQRNETFVPLVTVIAAGGTVRFRNSDQTMHDVYSFSPIKPFELKVHEGEISEPVSFDKVGTAAIGCNIHDHMITYVVITKNPWTDVSDERGIGRFDGLPAGRYTIRVWHPDLAPFAGPAQMTVNVSEPSTQITVSLNLIARRPMQSMHHENY